MGLIKSQATLKTKNEQLIRSILQNADFVHINNIPINIKGIGYECSIKELIKLQNGNIIIHTTTDSRHVYFSTEDYY